MYGSHCVKRSSNLQASGSLSSEKSGSYATLNPGAIGLSKQALLHDWGIKVDLLILMCQ